MTETAKSDDAINSKRPRRLRRRVLKWAFVITVVVAIGFAITIKDHLRTLYSLQRVPGSNAYVMDYYVNYDMEEVYRQGVNLNDLEGTFIDALFPSWIAGFAKSVKSRYVPESIQPLDATTPVHRCSTVALRSKDGTVYFGRNLDYYNDAYLILRIHDRTGLASVAVVDLAYLNLNRNDLDQVDVRTRIPLLFAPYFLMDGMNRHGLAISDMSVPSASPPDSPGRPAMNQSTMMRIILDKAKTTKEAVELIRQFNIRFVEQREHLMIADASGDFCIVEFLDGELKLTRPTNNWQVCTNHVVWQKSEAENDQSCDRYRVGSEAADKLKDDFSMEDVQQVARAMSVENWTMWTSTYDLTNRSLRVLYKAKLDLEYRDSFPKTR